MRFRILFAFAAVFVLTSLVFGAPAQVGYFYPGDYDCANNTQMTYGVCWNPATGTPIPGSSMSLYVFVNDVEYGPYAFTPSPYWCFDSGYDPYADGFFEMDYYISGFVEGDVSYCEVRYEGCTYRTQTFILASGANQIGLMPSDWISCDCGNPGCEVIEEYSEQSQ